MTNHPLVEIRGLIKHFKLPGGWLTGDRRVVHALDDINLDIYQGEVLGIVGESGCGKTTLGRCILQLIRSICSMRTLGLASHISRRWTAISLTSL